MNDYPTFNYKMHREQRHVVLFAKFENIDVQCSTCRKNVRFELIDGVECDWGSHNIIQCPHCEDLFSIDKQCIAFGDLLSLHECNGCLLTDSEKLEYLTDPHRD